MAAGHGSKFQWDDNVTKEENASHFEANLCSSNMTDKEGFAAAQVTGDVAMSSGDVAMKLCDMLRGCRCDVRDMSL